MYKSEGSMQVKFNDIEKICNITLFRKAGDIIILEGDDLPQENTSGFQHLKDNKVIADYSEYTVKYNVLTELENVLMLTNSEDNIETEDNPAGRYCHTPKPEEIKEDVDPLTNEELTECVADLMYEMSLAQLGMMGGE